MAQYIDKDAVVAEIERLIDSNKSLKTLDPTYCEGLDDSLGDVLSFLDTLEVKEVDLIINTIIAECCDWLAMNTNLSHDKIEGCRNLMLKVKEEQFKAQEPTEDGHWREVRERAAIAAMQGLLANPSRTGCFRDCAETAIEYTDALIKQLKTQKDEQFKAQKGE